MINTDRRNWAKSQSLLDMPLVWWTLILQGASGHVITAWHWCLTQGSPALFIPGHTPTIIISVLLYNNFQEWLRCWCKMLIFYMHVELVELLGQFYALSLVNLSFTTKVVRNVFSHKKKLRKVIFWFEYNLQWKSFQSMISLQFPSRDCLVQYLMVRSGDNQVTSDIIWQARPKSVQKKMQKKRDIHSSN